MAKIGDQIASELRAKGVCCQWNGYREDRNKKFIYRTLKCSHGRLRSAESQDKRLNKKRQKKRQRVQLQNVGRGDVKKRDSGYQSHTSCTASLTVKYFVQEKKWVVTGMNTKHEGHLKRHAEKLTKEDKRKKGRCSAVSGNAPTFAEKTSD